jgi:hypothetical protein
MNIFYTWVCGNLDRRCWAWPFITCNSVTCYASKDYISLGLSRLVVQSILWMGTWYITRFPLSYWWHLVNDTGPVMVPLVPIVRIGNAICSYIRLGTPSQNAKPTKWPPCFGFDQKLYVRRIFRFYDIIGVDKWLSHESPMSDVGDYPMQVGRAALRFLFVGMSNSSVPIGNEFRLTMCVVSVDNVWDIIWHVTIYSCMK